MTVFQQRRLHEAFAFAAAGGQALHLIDGRFAYLRRDTPQVFKNRAQLAHLFDQNKERLVATAKKLGVQVIRVEYPDHLRQHIDLCAGPLRRALQLCETLPAPSPPAA